MNKKLSKNCQNWVKEKIYPHYTVKYEIKNLIHEKQSPFQNIKIVESCQFGKMLLLDDIVQLTEVDEFVYHEMLVHIPMLTHPDPKFVYIVGGGDCGILREVLRHPVKKATMVELDKDVVDECQKYMNIAENVYSDKRADIICAEASITLEKSKDTYDIMLVDSTDPVGEAVKLFTPEFYRNAYSRMSDDGMIVTQSGSPVFQPTMLQMVVDNMKAVFPVVKVYTAIIPTYPGIYWSFTVGSKKLIPGEVKIEELNKRIKERNLSFKYYNSELHQSCFVLPEFVKSTISKKLPYGIFKSKDVIWNLD
ncbi:MAG: polyamine aminopropyltransferase [bacterium]|nr:polyamine aminopropyltransferase [bacterium]